jgi:hypothetical protein
MNKVFKHIVFFLLVFTAINVLAVYVFKKIIVEKTLLMKKEQQFNEYNDTLKYLCLGDSRIQNAVDTRILENCFNFSTANESYIQTYYKLKKLIEEDYKPKAILLPIDQTSFSEKYASRFKYNYYWVSYIDFFEVAERKKDWQTAFKYVQGKYFPYAGEYKLVNNYLTKGNKDIAENMINGFKPRHKDFANDSNLFLTGQLKARLYLKEGTYWNEVVVSYFKDLLSIAKENNIEVVVLKMPMTKGYLDGAKEFVKNDDFYNRLSELLSEYKNVTLLDYEKVFINDNSCFWNPDHLNYKGSQLFTKQLKKDLRILEQ